MVKEYTSEQFWELYKKLPQELKDALFAEETGNNIYEICKRNEIEENLDQIVDYVGQVLLGILPPNDFQETLEKELELEKEVAKKVNREIFRFIFYPVKESLALLYKVEVTPAKPGVPSIGPEVASPPEIKPPVEEKPEEVPGKDIYREPIE